MWENGNSLLETKRKNRVLIKNYIFRTKYATRTATAERLQLTLPTITTSVNEMLEEGILEETPMPAELLVNAVGRKPVAISFRADAAYAVGMEMGPYHTRIVLIDMKGKILIAKEEPPADEDYTNMLQSVMVYLQEIMAMVPNKNIIGIGIGIPGFIDTEEGMIRSNLRTDWENRYLARDLEAALSVPILIDNNVRLRAVGYEMEEDLKNIESFSYFYISRGVACPQMIRNYFNAGFSSGAGEIGQMILCTSLDSNEEWYLDDLGSEYAICEICKKKMAAGSLPDLKRMVDAEGELNVRQILTLQQNGNQEMDAILKTSIEYLGIGLANAVNLSNPGLVVVDGYLMKYEENRRYLKKMAKKRFYGLNEKEVQMIFKPFEHNFGAKGAGYYAIKRLFLEK